MIENQYQQAKYLSHLVFFLSFFLSVMLLGVIKTFLAYSFSGIFLVFISYLTTYFLFMWVMPSLIMKILFGKK